MVHLIKEDAKMKGSETMKAYAAGGFRERYAMENGNRTVIFVNGHKCIKYTYSKYREYQDANGATFDTVRGVWIN